MTKPTRGRIALWCTLAILWLLFLPQWFADKRPDQSTSWPGAIFWSVLLIGLLTAVARTIWRYRARP